jgi:heptosyltransferase-2
MKSYLGDAVMAQPSIAALRGATDELYGLSSRPVLALLSDYFPNGCGLTMDKGKGLTSTLAEARTLKRHGFELAVLVNGSFRSALVARLAGIPKRIGHAKEHRGFLLTDAVPHDRREFQATTVARLLGPLGLSATDRPRMQVDVALRAQGKRLLEGATIGFQPGARDPWKRIPYEKARAVAERVIASGQRLALIGGPEERADAEALASEFGSRVTNLAGGTRIDQLLGCLANLQACYGADTGLMHLSVAVGCPTIQVFASDRASKWGHAYSPHRIIECPEQDMGRLDVEELATAVLIASASSNVQA